MSKNQATKRIQRPSLRLFLASLLVALAGLAFSGCEKEEPYAEEETAVDEYGDPIPAEEVIQDSVYIVIEKRQSGGQLVPSGATSKFDGKPRMKRAPLEHMIIVRGDQTGEETAYLLPANDFFVVAEGHRLLKSTLGKWESTDSDHIPPPPPPKQSNRSRSGGADGNLVY